MTDEPDILGITLTSVMVVLIADIYKTLVDRGILTQGDAIARLEHLSRDVSKTAADPGLAVSLIDTVRDTIANELDRVLS
jgi:hypothetical protein